MKRLVAVCSLILLLSFPVMAGHNTPGFGWCDCDDPATHYQGLVVQNEDEHQHVTPELVTMMEAFAFWLSVRG